MVKSKITKIIKRNGREVLFDQQRITNAIFKAALSMGGDDHALAERVSDEVVTALNKNFSDDDPPTVEDIQDCVVDTLQRLGHESTAHAYNDYRNQRAMIREDKNSEIIVNDTIPYKILWNVYTWNVDHECDSIKNLNRLVTEGGIEDLIMDAEDIYHADIQKLADKIIARKDKLRIIIIAGPSSSGKTTTTIKLTEKLREHGLDVTSLELDNYFHDLESHPKDEFGDYDFERPEALDLALINEHLNDLLAGKTIQVPYYDFKTGTRQPQTTPFKLEPGQLLLLDSLHGLYKPMTESIPEEFKFKFFIETLCQIKDSKKEFVRWTDIRMLRRMVRDSWHRQYNPMQTVGHWHYVRRSEMKYIVPYIGTVDFIINGALPYELAVHKKYMWKYRDEILEAFKDNPKRFDAWIRARRIFDLLESVEELKDDSIIPRNSLMREYIGGSIYKY